MPRWGLIAITVFLTFATLGAGFWAFGDGGSSNAPQSVATSGADKQSKTNATGDKATPEGNGPSASPSNGAKDSSPAESSSDMPPQDPDATPLDDLSQQRRPQGPAKPDPNWLGKATPLAQRPVKDNAPATGQAPPPRTPEVLKLGPSMSGGAKSLIIARQDPRQIKYDADRLKINPKARLSAPFYDLVAAEVNDPENAPAPMSSMSDEMTLGYGRRLWITIKVSHSLEVPDSFTFFIEPILGGTVFQVTALLQLASLSPQGVEIKPGPDANGMWNHAYLALECVLPWPKEITDYYLYDDLSHPKLFAMVRSNDTRLQLRMRGKEAESEGTRTVFVALPDGNPAQNAVILFDSAIVAITDNYGRTEVPMPDVNASLKEARRREFTIILPRFMATPFTIHQPWPYRDESMVEVLIPAAEIALKVRFDAANAHFVIGARIDRDSQGKLPADWPLWAPPNPREMSFFSHVMLFFPESEAYRKPVLPVDEADGKRTFSEVSATTISSASLGLALRSQLPQMKLLDARPFGTRVFTELSAAIQQGLDHEGYYRLRVPAIRGHYLLPMKVDQPLPSDGEGPSGYKTPKRYFALRLSDASMAESAKTGSFVLASFKEVDLRRDYEALVGTSIYPGQMWLRYYFGDDGAAARPPLVPVAPVATSWDG